MLLAAFNPMIAFAAIVGAVMLFLLMVQRFTAKTHFSISGPSANPFAQGLSNYADGRAYGNVFFVNSAIGSDTLTGSGYSPETPFATIKNAVTKCVANNDDLILVLHGHTETLIGAHTVLVNTAGVTIRGVPSGGLTVGSQAGSRRRSTIVYSTSSAASFDVTAANVTLDNLVFVGTGYAAITAMVNVQAADCTIVNCEFEHGNATNQAGLAILTSALANRLNIENCFFHGTIDAGTTSAISLVGGTEITISNTRCYGSYSSGVGAITGATTDSLNLTIKGCDLVNRTANSTKVVTLTASSTGAIVNNRFAILSGSAPVTAAALDVIGGNYYKAAAGVAAGTLV